MKKSIKTDPKFRLGHVVETPPGYSMPPVDGFTPFWEEELALLYATDSDAKLVDLSVGQRVRFELRKVTTPRKSVVRIAYNITNI